MAGLLTHLGIALAGFLLRWLISKNYKYGLAFVIGHLIPDLIDFGTIGLFIGSVNPSRIMLSPWFIPLARLGHTWWHWIIFGFVVFMILFILKSMKKLSKKKFEVILTILIIFLAGVAVHLLIDALVIEASYWI